MGALGALWVMLCKGRCGAAAPCCFSCLCPLPSRNTRKKITVGQPREIFLPVMKQANGATCSCLPWSSVSSTLSFFNDL